jgi:regulator of protease activity HflC (stomatin/prohibitin superfamily)
MEMEIPYITGAIVLFAMIIISKGIKIVPQADMLIVERLGKYNRVLKGGLNFLIPIVDSISNRVTSKEQLIDIPSQSVITSDNVTITIDGMVYCTVENAKDATYNVVDFKIAVSNLAMTTLRSEIGSLALDETLSKREELNGKLQSALGEATTNWGVKVSRVEVSDISVPKEIEKAMQKQMEAERTKRATETTAEGQKIAQIRAAEGYKAEQVLTAEAMERMGDAKKYVQEKEAEGQANAMTAINNSMAINKEASEFLLAKDRIAAFDKLAGSQSTDKMIIPYEVTQMVGSMSVMSEVLFGKGEKDGKSSS